MTVERQKALQEAMTDDLVDGIMPANIFASDNEIAVCGVNRRRMQSASLSKRFLHRAQMSCDTRERRRSYARSLLDRLEMLVNGFDGRFAAKATARGSEHVAGKPREIDFGARREEYIHHITLLV